LKAILDNVPFAAWFKDIDGNYMAVNKVKEESSGYLEEEMLGKSDIDLFGQKNGKRMQTIEIETIMSGRQIFYEEKHEDGRWEELFVSPVLDSAGLIIGTTGLLRDITEKKLDEISLRKNESRLKRAQSMARLGNWELEGESDIMWVSDELLCMFGISQDSPYLKLVDLRQIIKEDDRIKRDVALESLMLRNRDYDIEYRITRPLDGQERYIHSTAIMEEPKNGVKGKALGIVQDITDRKRKENEIIYLNHHDQMTGLKNRFHFENAIKLNDNINGLPLSIIMIDVNGLKLTNDMFGYNEGDKLLKEISEILKKYSRKGDVAARIGGDEFSILMPKTSLEVAKKISCQILKACETYEGDGSNAIGYPSVSVGYAVKKDIEEKISDIMGEAEELMYKRKLFERKSVHSSLINSIKTTLFEKSHETEEHAERLVDLSNKVGLEMGLDDKNLNELNLLAALHDIGKMGVDDYILCKPGKLTEQEWAEIQKHPEVGFRIARSSPELTAIADYILCHHERWDGSGYPKGLKKRNIPLLSRIIAVVDAFDAMTQDRSYRKASAEEHAIVEIIKNSGSQFDPDVAIVFIKIMQDNYNQKKDDSKSSKHFN
ncbi:MAG: HD domain-containing phosphohydrolase, partial [Eubacteriales bacterium]